MRPPPGVGPSETRPRCASTHARVSAEPEAGAARLPRDAVAFGPRGHGRRTAMGHAKRIGRIGRPGDSVM